MGGISQFIANIYLVPSKRAANKAAKRSEYSDYSDAPEFFQRAVGGLELVKLTMTEIIMMTILTMMTAATECLST